MELQQNYIAIHDQHVMITSIYIYIVYIYIYIYYHGVLYIKIANFIRSEFCLNVINLFSSVLTYYLIFRTFQNTLYQSFIISYESHFQGLTWNISSSSTQSAKSSGKTSELDAVRGSSPGTPLDCSSTWNEVI